MELIKESWNSDVYKEYLKFLKSLSEEKYLEFNRKIIPGTEDMFGIRLPIIRKMAKDIAKGNGNEFVNLEKGINHEELIIAGLVLSNTEFGYEEFLPHFYNWVSKIHNWAICDSVAFNQILKNKDMFFKNEIPKLISSKNSWEVRYGLVTLLSEYLDDLYIDDVLKISDNIVNDFYYIQIANAWLIATAFTKQRDKTLEFLKVTKIDCVTYKMALQKIRDSLKVSKEDKILVTSLRNK